jgi:hypothetical protein
MIFAWIFCTRMPLKVRGIIKKFLRLLKQPKSECFHIALLASEVHVDSSSLYATRKKMSPLPKKHIVNAYIIQPKLFSTSSVTSLYEKERKKMHYMMTMQIFSTTVYLNDVIHVRFGKKTI